MKRLIILLTAAALGLAGGHAPAAEPAKKPNVLFCIADDASPHLAAYGYNWVKTPNIDGVAKQGLLFENAYTPTAKCAPSRAAILTGRNPWQLEEAANHQCFFPARYKAFSEALAGAGVQVGAAGKTWGPGEAKTAEGKPRGFGLQKGTGGNRSARPGDGFREFLAARPKDKPFFYWFGSGNPHRAYKADSGLAGGKKPADIDRVPAFWPDTDLVRRDMLDYAVEVEAFDAQVGSLLETLKAGGETENTLVIVTSDHGMPFPRVKGHNYDMANRVPLVVSWPKGIAKPGRRVAEFISFVDLAPTFLELFGVDAAKSGMSPITGHSFTDLLGAKPGRERGFVILGRERNDARARPGTEAGLGYPVRGLREDNLLYLHNFAPDRWPCGNPELGLADTDASPTKKLIEGSGEADRFWQLCFGKRPAEELFDVAADPDCVKNLAAAPEHRARMKELRDKLFAELKQQNDPRVLGNGEVFDQFPTVSNRRRGATEPRPVEKSKPNP
ncbi:MAG: sulfatase [Verrucomicrobiota bacterium]|nr:sulfatase [Verrucomicrobiota bacterium]